MSLDVFTNDVDELRQKLEAGHRVEWWSVEESTRWYNICQKRGREYVHVKAHSEKQAAYDWAKVHQRGYIRDNKTNRRVAIPGAR